MFHFLFIVIVEGNQYYDENGNLIRRVDRNGQTTRYDYDARNRLLQRVSKDETVGYTYDATGKRTSMSDSTGITSYQYDPYTEQLITVTFPDGLHLKNQYDANGNRIKMKEPFGSEVSYTYDTRNRLTSAGTDPSSPDAKYTYYKNGLLEQIIGFNGLKHQFQYAGIDLARLNVNQGEQTVDDFKYTRDGSKNIVKREQKSLVEQDETTDLFQYDVLNRVVGSSEYKASYEYDTRGNRQTLTTERPLKTVPSEYSYDAENRLTQVRKNGKNVQYMYNGDGLLVGRIEGGVQTRYYYDGDQIIAEATVENGTPKLKARYIWGQKLEAIQYADGTKAYPIYNGHGDIVELRDTKGNVLNTYNYDIWGNITSSQEKVYNPFRYSGELWDDTTELQYLRARWYDPDSGRFINEDTYEGDFNSPLSLNLYTYVLNNPLKYGDPTGHLPQLGDTAYGVYAHRSLGFLFKLANYYLTGKQVAYTEQRIRLTNGKIGYADFILKTGEDVYEVYELKPVSWSKEKNLALHEKGRKQLQGYIDGINRNGFGFRGVESEAYAGSRWNPNGLSIPSPYNAKKEITYYTYPNNLGMIYYGERNRRDKNLDERVPVTRTDWDKIKDVFFAEYYPESVPLPHGMPGGGFLPVPRMRVPIIL